MERPTLEYARARMETGEEPSAGWDFLAGLGLVAPFLTVPVFILGTAFFQDALINGDGHSWGRAALFGGVPMGLITAAGFVGTVRAVCLRRRPRGVAIVGACLSAVALGIIVAGIVRTL